MGAGARHPGAEIDTTNSLPRDTGAPLAGLRVLALGSDVATRVAGWWLAECGADVAIYRPGWRAPDAGSSEFAFERQVGRHTRPAAFDHDAAYDVWVGDSAAIAALRDDVPSALTGTASTVEITSPLPAAASFDGALLSDMALWARSGLGLLTREVGDDLLPGLPCLPLGRQPSIIAGIAAATAAVSAALATRAGGTPVRIACDRLELLALLPMQPTASAQIATPATTAGGAPAAPGGLMPSADGLVLLRPVEPAHWAQLFRLVDGLEWAANAVEQAPHLLQEAHDDLDAQLRAWAQARTTEALLDECQAAHIPVAPIHRPEQVIADRHLTTRGFFDRREAGEGLSLPWIARVDASAVGAQSDRDAGASLRPPSAGLPLAGLRVLDLTWAWAGPFATTMLADLGAEVVNIEWHPRASNLRRNAPFAHGRDDSHNTAGWWSANQRGKFSVGVNLKEPEGKQIVRALAARSDVVVENFSPGVVGRLGLGYDELHEVNPRLVFVSLSGYGQSGPNAHYVGYGTQLYAASGAGFATSQNGDTFSQMTVPYPDPVSGFAGAFVAAAYAYSASVSGRSAYLDVSELEALCCVLLEPLLAALMPPGASDSRNRIGYVVVPTVDHRFVALLVRDAGEHAAFRDALGADDDTPEALRVEAGRLAADAVLSRAAEAGLLAVAFHDGSDCLADPALNERGFWITDESPEVMGAGIRIGGAIWQVGGQRAEVWRGAPQLFGDTRTVLERLLEYEPHAVDDLLTRGIVQ